MAKVNKVEVEIVAVDEASPKIDRLTQKIDGLESDEARIIVTAEIDRFERQLSGARRLMENLEGDELTVQMRVAGRLEEDLEQARALFNQLDGQTGTVTLNADTSDLDQGLTRARGGLDDVGRSASSSKSVLANMVGNSTQDLGALGGIAGSTGVAIGQMGEYMADASAEGESMGSILRNFGSVAIPIAGVTGAMWALSRGTEQAAGRTRDLEEAIEDLTSATDEQVLAIWTQLIARAALDGERLDDQLNELAETNLIGAKRLLDVTTAAGATTEQTRLLREAIANAERAAAQAEETERRYGTALEETTPAVREQSEALADQVEDVDRLAGSYRRLAEVQRLAGTSLVVDENGNIRQAGPAPITARPTTQPVSAPATTQYITVIMPPGANPTSVYEAYGIFQSRNGDR